MLPFVGVFSAQGNPAQSFNCERSESCAGMNWKRHSTTKCGAMLGSMRILKLRHSVYQHEYHIVFGTRRRRKFLKEYVKPEFDRVMFNFQKKYPDVRLVESNLNNDHVHLLMEIPPDTNVAEVVKQIKWLTSLAFKKKFKFIREMYLNGRIWGVGYFSSTIGLNENTISKYIRYQEKQDTPRQVRLGFS